jgi:hypothetical protein
MSYLMYNFKLCGGGSAMEFLKYSEQFLTEENIVAVAEATVSQKENPFWHKIRCGRWTASVAHEAAHCHTPEGSLVEKILGASNVCTAQMQRGIALEGDVLNEIEKRKGITISKTGFFLSRTSPDTGGSPDGLSSTATYEVKCPSTVKSQSYYISSDGTPTPKIMAQLQMQMFLANREKCYLCVASDNFENTKRVNIVCVNYNESFTKNLMAAAQSF